MSNESIASANASPIAVKASKSTSRRSWCFGGSAWSIRAFISNAGMATTIASMTTAVTKPMSSRRYGRIQVSTRRRVWRFTRRPRTASARLKPWSVE